MWIMPSTSGRLSSCNRTLVICCVTNLQIRLRHKKILLTYQLPECSNVKPSLIFSNGRLCVMNSSRSNSFDRYSSTNFGTLCFDFHPPNAVPFHTRPVTNWNGLVLISCPAAATPTITDVPHPLWQDSNAALWKSEIFVKGTVHFV